MRKLPGLIKKLVVVVGIGALALVLFPRHTQPLWDWSKTTAAEIGHDPLPTFNAGQNYAGFVVLAVALTAVVYSMWRDRRYEVLRAEYTHQTGVTHLRRQIRELENRIKTLVSESQEWKNKYTVLSEKHASTLVASKEHEVRSEYGQEDRQVLKKLRDQFDKLIVEKGHGDGFREAMNLMMVHLGEQHPSSHDRQTQGRSQVSSSSIHGIENRSEQKRSPEQRGLPDVWSPPAQT